MLPSPGREVTWKFKLLNGMLENPPKSLSSRDFHIPSAHSFVRDMRLIGETLTASGERHLANVLIMAAVRRIKHDDVRFGVSVGLYPDYSDWGTGAKDGRSLHQSSSSSASKTSSGSNPGQVHVKQP